MNEIFDEFFKSLLKKISEKKKKCAAIDFACTKKTAFSFYMMQEKIEDLEEEIFGADLSSRRITLFQDPIQYTSCVNHGLILMRSRISNVPITEIDLQKEMAFFEFEMEGFEEESFWEFKK